MLAWKNNTKDLMDQKGENRAGKFVNRSIVRCLNRIMTMNELHCRESTWNKGLEDLKLKKLFYTK